MCVVCRFSINTIAVGVQIEILQNGAVLFTVRFTRTLTLNIVMGCIPIKITGYYDLYIYDVESDNTLSDSPAIIKNDVFVNEQTTTATIILGMTMSTSSSSVSSISTTSTS